MNSCRRPPAIAGLLALILVSLAGPVAAAEWSLEADVSERVEADTNFNLDGDGGVVGSTTALGMRLRARTGTTRWNLGAGTRISAFGGSGSDTGLDRIDPRVNGGVRHQGKRFSTGAAFGYSRTSVAFTQFGLDPLPTGSVILPGGLVLLPDNSVVPLDDFETISNLDATRTRLTTRGDITLFLDPVNRLAISGFGNIVRFSDDNSGDELVPTTTYGTKVAWGHELSERTSTNLSLGLQHFTADDAENTDSWSYSATGGIDARLTPRLAFGFDAGVSITDTERDSTGLPTDGDDGTTVGFDGGAALSWQPSEDMVLDFSASQRVAPSSLGELQSFTIVSFGVRHEINERSRFGLSASYSRQDSIGSTQVNETDRQLFALRPTYTFDLTADWRAQLGYILRLSDRDSDMEASNNVFFSISRSFDLLH